MRKIVSHTLIYLFFDAVNKAIPFILLPYLTHRLAVNEFGFLELFNTYVALLTLLVMFGVDGWCSANFHKLERIQFSRLLRVGLICIALAAVVSLAVLLFLVEDRRFLLAVLYAAGMSLIQLRAILFRLDFKTMHASVLLFFNVATSSLLTIYLFESGRVSFDSRLLGLMIPICILASWSIYSLWKQFPVLEMAAWHDARKLLKFTLPLLPNGLINFVRFGGDKFFVAHYFGLSVLAIFGVGYQFAMVANIFMLSLNQATLPFMMKYLSSNDFRKYVKVASFKLAFFTMFVLIIYMLLPYIVSLFFSENYLLSINIARNYFISYPMVFACVLMLNVLFFVGHTGSVLLVTIMSSLIHFCFLFYMAYFDLKHENIPFVFFVSTLMSLIASFVLVRRVIKKGLLVQRFS